MLFNALLFVAIVSRATLLRNHLERIDKQQSDKDLLGLSPK